jgi:hypothetical protein
MGSIVSVDYLAPIDRCPDLAHSYSVEVDQAQARFRPFSLTGLIKERVFKRYTLACIEKG